jgi:hypothetical protein
VQLDRHADNGSEAPRVGDGSLRRGAVRTVHVDRQTDDDDLDLFLAHDAGDLGVVVLTRPRPLQHGQWRGDRAGAIADGEADPFRAGVDAERPHAAAAYGAGVAHWCTIAL